MIFKKIISKEGWELRLHDEHEFFKNPILKGFNLDEPIEVSYCDLYLLAFNNTDYSLLTKEQAVSHLELLDKICYVNKQKELLDYAIANFQNNIDEWKSFINPSIVELKPEYLLTFPDLVDFNLEEFSKLPDCDDLKREKLLQYAQNGNTEAFSILFDISLINGNFLSELFICGKKWIEIIIDKGFDDWDKGLFYAAIRGEKDLVDLFIDKGANLWNLGMYASARGGHKNLIDFFIDKGANNWNLGMNGAAGGGNEELIELFIEKGANGWNNGMINAAFGGHKALIDFFISKGACDWNGGLRAASQGGHKELVDFFMKLI